MLQKLAFRKDFKISVLYVEMADMFPGLRSTELVIWISILGPESFFFYLRFDENILLLLFMWEGEETCVTDYNY